MGLIRANVRPKCSSVRPISSDVRANALSVGAKWLSVGHACTSGFHRGNAVGAKCEPVGADAPDPSGNRLLSNPGLARGSRRARTLALRRVASTPSLGLASAGPPSKSPYENREIQVAEPYSPLQLISTISRREVSPKQAVASRTLKMEIPRLWTEMPFPATETPFARAGTGWISADSLRARGLLLRVFTRRGECSARHQPLQQALRKPRRWSRPQTGYYISSHATPRMAAPFHRDLWHLVRGSYREPAADGRLPNAWSGRTCRDDDARRNRASRHGRYGCWYQAGLGRSSPCPPVHLPRHRLLHLSRGAGPGPIGGASRSSGGGGGGARGLGH